MKAHALKVAAAALLIAGLISQLQLSGESPSEEESATTGIGDVRSLLAAYEGWKARYTRNGEDQKLVLPLAYSKGRSAEFTKAHGQATLDLIDGGFSVEVIGLSDEDAFDVWLLDNRRGLGRSVNPEPRNRMVRVGSLKYENGTANLQARLDRKALTDFEINLVVVSRTGKDPGQAGVLIGSPTLFQLLYYSAQRRLFPAVGNPDEPGSHTSAHRSRWPAPFRVLIPTPAYAKTGGGSDPAALIARGEDIFFNETFDGNGRTCGTCHPAENNFTIDPAFIATLPSNDPLFVADSASPAFNPALAENFENPKLMRDFGLILENVDGFDKFVMRGVPHTLGLSTSLTPAPIAVGGISVDGTMSPPNERTGWSGDGAPGSGTLREFATGAVRQHFTKTLNRMEGVDFRLPTEDELDALEAFQRSLGRPADLDLSTLKLKGETPRRGLQIFLTVGKCQNCHANVGANVSFIPGGFNFNFNTGVENFPHPAGPHGKARPRDGGFGTTDNGDGKGGFGDGTFNTPPLVEAADTGPFFHNNLIATIEDAVSFYNSLEFNGSPAGQILGGIQLLPNQVVEIAAFLRVINALENIRSSIALEERALEAHGEALQELLRLSTAKISDAIAVLRDKGLHPDAVTHLEYARANIEYASTVSSRTIRNIFIRRAIDEEKTARGFMVDGV